MMKRLIACCGLDCEHCDARRATIDNDDALRERTARKWSEMNDAPQITAATIHCTGCRTEGVKFAYCRRPPESFGIGPPRIGASVCLSEKRISKTKVPARCPRP